MPFIFPHKIDFLYLLLMVGLLTNCSHKLAEIQQLGSTDIVVTEANARLGYVHQAEYDFKNHRIKAQRVFCAEPSPDIAEAVQHAFGFGVRGEGVHPSGIKAGLGLSLTSAEAQAVAQLGERIATIQLLRDALYRACEAYANGAFSEITYAVLLSRYDDMMLSSLLGELAAGNFGRQLSFIGGTTIGTASTDGKVAQALNNVFDAKQAVNAASDEVQKRIAAVDAAKTAGDTDTLQSLQMNSEKAKSDLTLAEEYLDNTLTTLVHVKAEAQSKGSEALQRTPSVEMGKLLKEMQRSYLYDINSDALKVACVTAMAREKPGELSILSQWCSQKDGALETLVREEGKILEILVSRGRETPIEPSGKIMTQSQSQVRAANGEE
ncbi:MAG: hypothetical protein AB7P17_11385 [Nitrospirales bacterium]